MISLFNILLLCFWLRLLPQRSSDVFRNPVVSRAAGLADRVAAFLQGALPFAPRYALAFATLCFLLVLRGAFAAWTQGVWVEGVGLWTLQGDTSTPARAAVFSLLSFGLLLHRLFTLQLVLAFFRKRPAIGQNPVFNALRAATAPLSDLPRVLQLAVAVVSGSLLAQTLFRIGKFADPLALMAQLRAAAPQLLPAFATAASPSPTALARLGFGLAAVLDVCSTATTALFAAVIGLLIANLFSLGALAAFCAATCDMLLAPFFRRPVRVGALNVAPLLFLLLMGFIQSVATIFLLILLGAGAGQ